MKTIRLAAGSLAALLAALSLAACGGGGGAPAPAAPVILTPPTPQVVLVGEAATFSVEASGAAVTYRWQLDSEDIPGATGPSYTTPAATLDHDGRSYRVVVANQVGSVTSAAVRLTVQPLITPARVTPWVEGGGGTVWALKADGTVWAWGNNTFGQLGQGHTRDSLTPVPVRDPTGAGVLDRVVKLSATGGHALALRDDGTVWSWGNMAALGAVEGGAQLATLPVQVAGIGGVGVLTGVVDVSAGFGVSAAVLADGTVVAWGDNRRGAAGVGSVSGATFTPATVWFPSPVAGATGVVQVSAGDQRVLARRADGTILSWGSNPNGELGRETGDTASPGLVGGISSAVRVVAGERSAAAILADGSARIWGHHGYSGGGEVCEERSTASPVVIPVPSGAQASFTAVAPLWPTTILVHDGRLLENGRPLEDLASGRCAGGLSPEPSTTEVVGVARFNGWSGLAWTRDGKVHGFGSNGGGELGLGHADTVTGVHEVPGFNLLGTASAGQVAFFTDFDAVVPPEVSAGGAAAGAPVQGFGGYGPAGEPFGGSFLRSATGNTVTLTLTGLPAHRALSLGFLFAAIDSLDGAGTFPAGDFFKITLDGETVFREAFANAVTSQVQTYLPPPGVELARWRDLGFGGPGSYYTDSAYDLAADPRFQLLPHTAPDAVFTFQIEGAGIQDLNDESWAMDNLRVTFHP
ncbi:MAG: hypothetical protein NDI82_12120 [Anaeromyxobacteraceae bacterium]|nr:hypothetical protein [Anaeromyxobacteraceae bacterium]